MKDSTTYSIPHKWLRPVSLSLDGIIYFLLSIVFEIFFNITSATIFNNTLINQFFNRIQLLIGIFIVFKVSFSIINGIINPDQVTDSKKGISNFVLRIVISLAMLTLITPLSGIPDDATINNSYNKALKEQGILFGTLQTLQDRIINQNLLGKLILGVDEDQVDNTNNTVIIQSQKMIATIVKGFVQLNLDDNGEWVCGGNYEDDNTYNSYIKGTYNAVLAAAEAPCKDSSSSKYKFSYIWGFSWIIGVAFIFIVAGFCVDIAVRLIKLLVLRLIAPIPIISYIDPKSDKDGAFGAWTKMLTKTYLDLFIRLMIIYFVMFIASNMISMVNNNLVFKNGGVNLFINTISIIIIWLGLFIFAKSAPKFFMDMLGIKGDGKGFFQGIGAIAGAGAFAGGLIGSAVTGWRASAEENRMAGRTNPVANAFRNLASSATSTIGGAWAGGRAALTSQDHLASNIFRAQQQRNALRAAHSTLLGRINDNLFAMLTGRSLAQRDQGILDLNNTAFSSIKDWQDSVKDAAIENGDWGEALAKDGQKYKFNYAQLLNALEHPNSSTGKISLDGNSYDPELFDENFRKDLLKNQTIRYVKGATRAGKDSFTKLTSENQKLYSRYRQVIHDTTVAGIDSFDVQDYNTYGKAMGQAGTKAAQMSNDLRHIARRANSQANGNNHK